MTRRSRQPALTGHVLADGTVVAATGQRALFKPLRPLSAAQAEARVARAEQDVLDALYQLQLARLHAGGRAT
jgi:hypothetical protein